MDIRFYWNLFFRTCNFFEPTILRRKHFLAQSFFFLTKFFTFFLTSNVLEQKVFANFFLTKNYFLTQNPSRQKLNYLDPIFFWAQICFQSYNFFSLKSVKTQFFFVLKIFLDLKFLWHKLSLPLPSQLWPFWPAFLGLP